MSVTLPDSNILIDRIIIEKLVDKSLPTLVVMVGIHGNETTGIIAVKSIEKKLKEFNHTFKANLYVIAGNLNAIAQGKRYESVDLNRLWTDEQLHNLKDKKTELNADEKEQIAVYNILKDILNDHTGKFYFVDLHATSAPTSPYLVFSDSVNNRVFSRNFPVPIVFGIEAYIKGPLLTYINEYGHVGVGFEAGSHDDKNAVLINESFLWIALVETGCLTKSDIPNYDYYIQKLDELSSFSKKLFDIVSKHSIQKGEDFKMLEGFDNFQKIRKNQALATSNSQTLFSQTNAQIFMPLYQKQGDDGYFIIREVSKHWLFMSRFVRKHQLYFFLKLLPSVSFVNSEQYMLKTNSKPMSTIKTYLFRLFGFRQKTACKGVVYYTRRDREVSSFNRGAITNPDCLK